MIYSDKQKYGIIIRYFRQRDRISQRDFSKRINYDQSMISRLENSYSSVGNDIIESALSELELKHNYNENVTNEIKALTDKIYTSYENLDFTGFSGYLTKISELLTKSTHIFSDIELNSLKLFCLFVSSRDVSVKLLENVLGLINTTDSKIQELFTIYCLERKHKVVDNTLMSPLLAYYLAKKAYEDNFFAKAVSLFYKSFRYYLEKKCFTRVAKIQIMLNRILLKDFNYQMIYVHRFFYKRLTNILPCDRTELDFQVAYASYHLQKYDEALNILLSIEENSADRDFIRHLINKCRYKLNQEFNPTEYFLDRIYFTSPDRNTFSEIVEKEVLPQIDEQFYKKEFQCYVIKLLEYYYSNRNYKKYSTLANKINQLMHN